MMMFITFLIISQICFALNVESDCGCNSAVRSRRTHNIFSEFFNQGDKKQCPKDEETNAKRRDYDTVNMILVPSDEYQVGTDDIVLEKDKEGPKKLVKLNSFYLDKYEVSNSDFAKFISATGYRTEAEKFGDSFVFSIFLNSTFRADLVDYRVVQALWWYKVNGANWKHPFGPDSNITDLMDHPVVHVSWRDARSYCTWRHARLPTEAEWEAACRAGKKDTLYPWGDKLYPDKQHMANIWQGTFPRYNSKKDGYIGTNPVNLFPQNDLGFHNLAGNVWEWTEDIWSTAKPEEKVKKGGSYLCHRSYCYRYRCSARSQNTEDSTAGNLGFRCARHL